MVKSKKYILGIAGVISGVVGITFTIPSMLQGKLTASVVSTILIVTGLVLIAYALGD